MWFILHSDREIWIVWRERDRKGERKREIERDGETERETKRQSDRGKNSYRSRTVS